MEKDISLPWLLVATPQLMDTNFKKSVVLVVEDNDEGAMGFVINRPCEVSLAEVLQQPDLAIPQEIPTWFGGPVDPANGVILHNNLASLEDENAVRFDKFGISSNEEVLMELIDFNEERLFHLSNNTQIPEGQNLYPYRFIVGYSGWGPGQLTDEIRQGAWIQTPLSHELIFNANWDSMWERALGNVGINPRILAPANQPFLN